jgi:succinoglycan biosynthesis transport protein ExoP
MDYETKYQQFSENRNSTISSPLSQNYLGNSDESNGDSLDIGWVFAVVRRRALIMAGVGIALSVVAGALLVKSSRQIIPDYSGGFKLLVEPITAEGRLAQLYLMAQTSDASSDIQRIKIEDTSLVDYETLIRVFKSPKLLLPVFQKLQEQYPKMSYGMLYSNLSLERISVKKGSREQGTKLLVVKYKDRDPKRIETVLEFIKKAYLEYSQEERIKDIRNNIEFLEKKLPELQSQVDILQAEMQILRENYQVLIPEKASGSLTDHSLGIQRLRVNAQTTLAQARIQYANVEKQFADGNIVSILARDPKAYEVLIGQLQRIESEVAVESALFFEDSEPMLQLEEKRQNLRELARQQAQDYLESLAGQIRELEANEQQLAATERQLKQQLRELPMVVRQYDDLQLELEVATKNLKEFLAKREALEIDLARQKDSVGWQVIEEPAVPRDENGRPISITVTQTKRQLIVAVIVSMLLGVGAGFLVEVLISVFHTPDELKNATKLPLLGIIPFAKDLKKKSPDRQKKSAPVTGLALAKNQTSPNLLLGAKPEVQPYSSSPILEAFRSLYTNIRLLSYQNPIQSLVIGAATAGEGKSTVAVHLAKTAAAIGQRVLLVDADLRSPKIHAKFDVPNLQGLSDAISTDISLNDVIQRSPEDENLFVLTAGPIPEDPIKLLSSKKMHSLMEQFQDFFDVVIYDTPPLVGLADGNFLAAQTDGLVLVTRLAKTDRSIVQKAQEGLKISGARVLGVVANGVR